MQFLSEETITVLLAGGKGERLLPLTEHRPKPMVHFGGSYRVVDFVLSNCLHSGLIRIFVLPRYKADSLNRHLSFGWNIFSSERNEFLRVLLPQQAMDNSCFPGTAGEIHQNIQSLRVEKARYIVILSGDQIYQMDYRNLLEFHSAKKAALTIAVAEVDRETARRSGVVAINEAMEVVYFEEKPEIPDCSYGQKERFFVSMGIYVFNFEDMVEALEKDMVAKYSSHDFGRDVIPSMLAEGKKIVAFPFRDEESGEVGYWRDIGTVPAYFEANMDLVGVKPTFDLYRRHWPWRTYLGQFPPTKIVFHERIGESIFGGGCVIDEGEIWHSILGSGVRIGKDGQIIDSIIMNGVVVGEGSRIVRAIIDENNIIPPGSIIEDGNMRFHGRYEIAGSGIVIVPAKVF